MMPELKKYIKCITVLFLLLVIFNVSFAGTAILSKIGNLDLSGNRYPEWWYTEINPTFYGVAVAGSTVNIKIGDNSYTTTADASGNWSYYAALDKGDYPIVISSGSDSYSFTLHLGQPLPENIASGSSPAGTAPATGFNQFIGITLGAGIVLLATYLYFSSDNKKKTIFENRMLKED